ARCAPARGGRALLQPGGDPGGEPRRSALHRRYGLEKPQESEPGRRRRMNPIALEALTVRYGRRLALDQVSLDIPEGSVYALLGRNGAGKSSLVRCLLGGQRPSSGRAMLLGRDVWRERAA